ncbi:unnamed protein product, partial [marine sediment metagenome]
MADLVVILNINMILDQAVDLSLLHILVEEI